MSTDTCKVCHGPMGPESSSGYCSLECFDAETVKRPRLRSVCVKCGGKVKAGNRFCGSKCLGQSGVFKLKARTEAVSA